MRIVNRATTVVVSIAALGTIGLSACSQDESSESATTQSAPATTSAMAQRDPAAGLVGAGCADYTAKVPTGAGSMSGMAQDPVAVAASNNPLLTTLTSAVSGKLNPGVNLVDTLNGGQFTVFAPVDDAFKKVDPATIETLKTDAPLLTKILTYHVVAGQVAPDKIAGEHTTVQGAKVRVSGSGDTLKVNDANVVCGGVRTANATVYLIDSVLLPPAA